MPGSVTSGAKAQEFGGFFAALKRRTTQKHPCSPGLKADFSGACDAGLKARLFHVGSTVRISAN